MRKVILLIVIFYVLLFWFFTIDGQAADVYLDVDATESGCAGTTGSPCKELDHIEAAGSGDNVYLQCGDTWSRADGDWGAVGTAIGSEIDIGDSASVDGITIGAYYFDDPNYRIVDGSTYNCPGELPTIDGDVDDFSTGTVTTATKILNVRASTGRTAENIFIQDIKMTNYGGGVYIRQRDGGAGQIDEITVQRCEVYNVGRGGLTAVQNPRSFSSWTVSNINFLYNTVTLSHMAYCDGCTGWRGWGAAIVLKNVDTGVMRGNIVDRTYGEGINTHECTMHVQVYDNIVINSASMGVYASASHDVHFHHNYAIHTDADWDTDDTRANGALGFGSEGDCDVSGATCTENNCIDSSGVYFWGNVGIGYDYGVRVHDGKKDGTDDTDDGTYGVNKFFNNSLIDNDVNFGMENTTTNEVFVEFQNNLSILNTPAWTSHTNGQTINTSLYTMLGNGWDESEAVGGSGFCTSGNCTSGGDITGDPDLVEPGPCSGNWRYCTSWDTPDWGDAALGEDSDFINAAVTISDTGDADSDFTTAFEDCLDPVTDWPDSVVTADQGSYTSWEFGAYVYTGAAVVEELKTMGVEFSGAKLN